MTERERILAAAYNEKPDRVPYMLDLSHYYYHKYQKDWDLCKGYVEPERELIDFNRKMGAAFYMPNQARFYGVHYDSTIKAGAVREIADGSPEITWSFETPVGRIERKRRFMKGSYSWAINKWGVEDEKDLEVLKYALTHISYEPLPENYKAWADYTGDDGVVYLSPGYSAMGQLLHYWMGVENTVYASYDFPEELHDCVDAVNENVRELVSMLASEYDAPVIITGDNFSSDIQPPEFFNEWSRDHYEKTFGMIHAAGKRAAVHIDGKLTGAITMLRKAGADIIDAVTPGTVGGITAAEARKEADTGKTLLGNDLVLSGGIPNELWYERTPFKDFEKAVTDWLDTAKTTSAVILAAGDQVPPGADEKRIIRMGEIVRG